MLQAPQIRKLVLLAVEQHILPALRNPGLLQARLAPPFDLANVKHWNIKQPYLPPKTPDPFQVAWYWKKEQMAASRFPYFIFMCEGVADHKMGFTQEMAARIANETGNILPGAVMVRLPSPCVAYCAPFFPGHSSADISPEGYKSVCFAVMNENVDLHLTTSQADGNIISHSLQIPDSLLAQLGRSYEEELLIANNDDVAQAQLYVFMNRIYRWLSTHRIPLANSAWPAQLAAHSTASDIHKELYHRTIEFIDTRLNNKLDRTFIADAMDVSADHLGRTFRHMTGYSVMRYVTQRRLDAAKMILINGTENITEIAHLTGFASVAALGVAFKRIYNVSPKEYRRKYRKKSRRKAR